MGLKVDTQAILEFNVMSVLGNRTAPLVGYPKRINGTTSDAKPTSTNMHRRDQLNSDMARLESMSEAEEMISEGLEGNR